MSNSSSAVNPIHNFILNHQARKKVLEHGSKEKLAEMRQHFQSDFDQLTSTTEELRTCLAPPDILRYTSHTLR